MTKITIALSAIIVSSIIGVASVASAAGPSVYVSPASLTKTVGDTLNLSVGFTASGNRVCAVEGTIVFKNLSCQSITLAGDVTPQSAPTCSNPRFLIGIPSCTTVDKVLLTVSAKAVSGGTASVSFTGVDIIGEGTSLGSASVAGNYTVQAVVQPVPITPQPEYQYYPAEVAPVPVPARTPKKKTVVATSTTAIAQAVEQASSTSSSAQVAAVAEAVATSGSTGDMFSTWWAWVALLIVVITGVLWSIYRRLSGKDTI